MPIFLGGVQSGSLTGTRPFLFCWLLRTLWPEPYTQLPMLHYYSGPLLFDTTPSQMLGVAQWYPFPFLFWFTGPMYKVTTQKKVPLLEYVYWATKDGRRPTGFPADRAVFHIGSGGISARKLLQA